MYKYTISGAQESIPASTASTGSGADTITSYRDGSKIVGVGTAFLADLETGDYIYIKAQNDFRKVKNIVSDTECTLHRPFGSALAATAFDIVKRSDMGMISIAVLAVGGAITVDGVTLAAAGNSTDSKVGVSGASNKVINPVDVVPGANSAAISITY